MMGTHWEQIQKNPPAPLRPKTQKVKKNYAPPEPSHWLHGISISKKGW